MIIAVLAAAMCGLSAMAGERPSADAFEQLLGIRIFAFGGVGEAAETSAGELAFKDVAGRTNAVELLTRVATNGTSEARMYGLCGLRKLAEHKFDACAAPTLAANPPVRMMTGCVVHTEPASNVVSQIRAGGYDSFIGKPQK